MSDKLNIFQRMSKVTEEIGIVAKNLKVDVSTTNSYKAVSERDILDAVKPIEAKYGVYSYPSNREILSEEVQERETKYGIRKELFMRIKTTYRFVNVDAPLEYIETVTYADGIDSGDKATGKAMTYADKYALMKAYKISTGEDPDQEASTELKQAEKKASKATDKQILMIKQLYTLDELNTMLNRLNKDIYSLTIQEASKMISARKGTQENEK